jgi:hypothetical protein
MNTQSRRLSYERLDQIFLEAFPELHDRYKQAFDYWGDDSKQRPGSYGLFSNVVYPYVIEALDSGQSDEILTRLFLFFEEMSSSKDAEVRNLLGLEVIDELLRHPARLARAWKYMGHSTKSFAAEAANTLNLKGSLPR